MGWVCENCSTNLDDDMVECFACGARRSTAAILRDEREKAEQKLATIGDKLYLLATNVTKIVFVFVAFAFFVGLVLAIIRGSLFVGINPGVLAITEKLKNTLLIFAETIIPNTIMHVPDEYVFESMGSALTMILSSCGNMMDNISVGETLFAYMARLRVEQGAVNYARFFDIILSRIKSSWITISTYGGVIFPTEMPKPRNLTSDEKIIFLLEYFSQIYKRIKSAIKSF